jgi:hypothetical protein
LSNNNDNLDFFRRPTREIRPQICGIATKKQKQRRQTPPRTASSCACNAATLFDLGCILSRHCAKVMKEHDVVGPSRARSRSRFSTTFFAGTQHGACIEIRWPSPGVRKIAVSNLHLPVRLGLGGGGRDLALNGYEGVLCVAPFETTGQRMVFGNKNGSVASILDNGSIINVYPP